MENLFDVSKKLLVTNINCNLDEEIINILSLAILGLSLLNPEIVSKKLPKILNELNIFYGDKKVKDLIEDNIPNFSGNIDLTYSKAMVNRDSTYDSENDRVNSKTSMVISLENDNLNNIPQLINSVIHEFIHLLRFGNAYKSGNNLIMKAGVSLSYLDMITGNTKRKHIHIEEGIVQKITNDTLKELERYLSKHNIKDNELCLKFIKQISAFKYSAYPIEVGMITTLCEDKTFENLLYEGFEDVPTPSQMANRFNQVLNSNNAFTLFSRKVDQAMEKMYKNENFEEKFEIVETVREYVSRTSIIK